MVIIVIGFRQQGIFMAKKRAAKAAVQPAPTIPPALTMLKISLEHAGDPLYANYAEVSSAQHEFQIAFGLAPTKPTAEQIEQLQTGTMRLPALVQILLPPTIIPGLIKALIISKEQHEALLGPIKELDI
jgi:hypothetical protein